MGGIGINKFATNPVTDKLRSGQPAVGTWLSLCSPVAAEGLAHIGWDWLVVDVEHSPVGFDTMVNCFRAIQLGGAVPMARVPWNDTIWIQRTLDAGALGLVVPMVNTAEQAKKVVSKIRGSISRNTLTGYPMMSRPWYSVFIRRNKNRTRKTVCEITLTLFRRDIFLLDFTRSSSTFYQLNFCQIFFTQTS